MMMSICLEGSLVATGFPYRANTRYIDAYLAMLKVAMESTAGVRRPGAACSPMPIAFAPCCRTRARPRATTGRRRARC